MVRQLPARTGETMNESGPGSLVTGSGDRKLIPTRQRNDKVDVFCLSIVYLFGEVISCASRGHPRSAVGNRFGNPCQPL